jgi:hypothetical protein
LWLHLAVTGISCRLMVCRRKARTKWKRSGNKGRTDAYTAGVNEYIKTLTAASLPWNISYLVITPHCGQNLKLPCF